MANPVGWIKLTTDMFDNRKIKHLRRLPDGNNIVLIWVMLLTMAGRCNAGGMIFLTENIPYTPKMLADELDFEESTVALALQALENFNMIVTDGHYFSIAGWAEYQNIEGMDKIREQTRKRVAKHRENQKTKQIGASRKCVYCGGFGDTVDHVVPKTKGGLYLPENTVCSCLSCNMQKNDHDVAKFLNDRLVMNEPVDIASISENDVLRKHIRFDYASQRFVALQVTLCNATEEDKDKELEKELERDIIDYSSIAESSVSYQKIIEMFHSICKSFPKVRSLSEARRKAIRARLKTYSVDDFKTVFQNAEDSSFLKGKNDRNWQANFDWLIADKNMAKVLEGQYADRGKKEKLPDWFGRRELDEDEVAAINRMLSEPDDETEQLRRELQSLGGRQ